MNAEYDPDLTICRFEAGRIDAASFDHKAHVYVAWLYLQAYDLGSAITRFDDALGRLTAKLGVPGKYHATITWALLILIRERMREGEGWQTFCSRNPDLLQNSRAILGRYYSDERLFSDLARTQFVLPDRLAS